MDHHIIIEGNSPQARQLLKYLKTLPYVSVPDEAPAPRKDFWEQVKKCNAISHEEFIGELRRQVDEHFAKQNNA